MTITNKFLLIVLTGLTISSCSSIKLTAGGEKVRVLAPNEISSCKKLGQTSASVTDKVVVKRPIETIELELITMARNSADNMGGDTVVPLTIVEGGKQSFTIYKCIDPDG
jgi:hypothetical protein